jgi:hypothetical protein
MPITPLGQPPLRSDGPALFADRGDAFMASLPLAVMQANELEANVNAKEASAVNAADVATNAADVATNASAIASSSASFKGNWSSLTGALLLPSSVYHNNFFWALNTNLADVTTATPGVDSQWTKIKLVVVDFYTYENRANLRSLSPVIDDQAIVDGLGYFVWQPGSTEPDDDESAFATASGVWLLQAPHWDLLDAWNLPEWEVIAADDEDEPLRFSSKILSGSATCAISSVATDASASFTGTVPGASVGDRVIATPPAQLGTDSANTGRLSYHAWVSASGTVTIMLTNASASSATINSAVKTAWSITVIKT